MAPNEFDLSERECEILRLVATGASNKEIAQQLAISTNTVKVHLRNVYTKIGVTSRTEATLFAIREGLVERPSSSALLEEGDENLTKSSSLNQNEGLSGNRKYFLFAGIIALIVLGGIWWSFRSLLEPPKPVAPSNTSRWQIWAPLPAARSDLAAVAYNNQIFAIGGETAQGITGEVDLYTPNKDSWATLEPKPTPVKLIGAVVIGGKIYVPGGVTTGGKVISNLEVFDPKSAQWITKASVPSPISGYAIAAVEGKIYLFGGNDGTKTVNTVYEYDPDLDSWSERSPMPSPRELAGAAVINDKVYVIGGMDGKTAVNFNEMYSPDLEGDGNPWEEKAPAPFRFYSLPVIGMVDNIFIMSTGGRVDSAPVTYSVESDEWQSSSQQLNNNLAGSAGVLNQTNIHVLGGKTKNDYSSVNVSYRALYTILIPVYK